MAGPSGNKLCEVSFVTMKHARIPQRNTSITQHLCSEMNGEERMELEEELEMALQRVLNEKQLKYIPQLEHALTLAQQKERILAAQILADKELHCPRSTEGKAAEGEEESLDLRIDGLEKALLNHRIVKSTLQSAAFSIQMQETIKDIMQKTDVDGTMDQQPGKGLLLSHCSSNLHTHKELASVMEQKSNLENEILGLQTKYMSLLTVIREKWEALQDKVKQPDQESKALSILQNKLKAREGKIQLLVTMIQGLITSSNFQWGASNYCLQVMLLCDSVTRNLDTAKQNDIMKEISKIHEEKEDKENRSEPRQTLITESLTRKK